MMTDARVYAALLRGNDEDWPSRPGRPMSERERLARLIAEEEGVAWDRQGADAWQDRRALMVRAFELEGVTFAEQRALARFHVGETPKGGTTGGEP